MKRLILITILVSLLVACGGKEESTATPVPAQATATPAPTSPPKEKLKVAFVYVAPIGDLGWTWAHDQGRLLLEQELGDKVETAYIENVPEGPDAERVIRDFAQKGYDLIFTTSFGFMDPTITVAAEYPETWFVHISGYETASNVSTVFGKIEQPRFLSGLVAGKATKTNKIGYVAAFPIPEVVRGINAFTLGVRAVNPEATVTVVWTNTWFGPPEEKEAAEALLDQGMDVIAQHQDTTEPQKAASGRGAVSIGYDSDMRVFVGDSVLTSPVWNWGVKYVDIAKKVMEGTYQSESYWGGMDEKVVGLAPLSPLVSADVAALVEEHKVKILAGQGNVFCGPIHGQNGELSVAEGSCMSDEEVLNMSWFVEGVVGEAPAEPPVPVVKDSRRTVILSAFTYPNDQGVWQGESGPFLNLLENAEEVTDEFFFCQKVVEGELYSQPVTIVTMGVGKVHATSCMVDLLNYYQGSRGIKEVIWSGISGFSPTVGGLGGEPTVIGDVCISPFVVDYDLHHSAINPEGADELWLMSWPNPASEALGSTKLAEELYRSGLLVEWPEMPEGSVENVSKYHGVDLVRLPKVFHWSQCSEATGDNFWHSEFEDAWARQLIAQGLSEVFGEDVSADDVIAVTAMENVGWMDVVERWNETTGDNIPFAYSRSSSNFDQPWLNESGQPAVSGPESISAGMDAGGSSYGSITAALPVLKMLELRSQQ